MSWRISIHQYIMRKSIVFNHAIVWQNLFTGQTYFYLIYFRYRHSIEIFVFLSFSTLCIGPQIISSRTGAFWITQRGKWEMEIKNKSKGAKKLQKINLISKDANRNPIKLCIIVSHRSFIGKADDGEWIRKLSSKNITLLNSYEVMAKSLNPFWLFLSFSIFHFPFESVRLPLWVKYLAFGLYLISFAILVLIWSFFFVLFFYICLFFVIHHTPVDCRLKNRSHFQWKQIALNRRIRNQASAFSFRLHLLPLSVLYSHICMDLDLEELCYRFVLNFES